MIAKQEIILVTDEKSATYRTDITGWVSHDGRYCGADENFARYSGSTHSLCKVCGEITDKGRTICSKCRDQKEKDAYIDMPKSVWNGTDALYSTSRDEWFFDEQDLIDHCYDNRETCDDLKLVIGVPVYAAEIDPYDHYADDLPEDMDLPDDLEQAFKELNETIRFCKIPLSWSHGRFAAIITQKEKTNGIN